MFGSYAVGIAALVLICVTWVGVQVAWRRAFPGAGADPDALAGRMGCQGCGCIDRCESEEERQ